MVVLVGEYVYRKRPDRQALAVEELSDAESEARGRTKVPAE